MASQSSHSQEIVIPSPADFHVHLRQGELMKLVAPHVEQGGISLAYVMPNLSPPLTTVSQATAYHSQLASVSPHTTFLSTLYLSPSLTPEEIRLAAKSGIVGVKSYPRGVTTGSESGIEGYEAYYEVFEEMEKVGMVLNLHGEIPSSSTDGTTVLNAEPRFLPHLRKLHERFPKLRIVLEHATTKEAVDCVKSLGPTVASTITPHHLVLTVDDWAGNGLNYCKPVAKRYEDRNALRQVIAEGNPKFFLGSDSAPHPHITKLPQLKFSPTAIPDSSGPVQTAAHSCAAGIYTQPILLPLLATVFESIEPKIPVKRVADFASGFGRTFYGFPVKAGEKSLTLRRRKGEGKVPLGYAYKNAGEDVVVVPFWAGKQLDWEIQK